MASIDAPANKGLIKSVTDYLEAYMVNYGGSHGFNHIQRVLGLAETHTRSRPSCKYSKAGADTSSLAKDLLAPYGAKLIKKCPELAVVQDADRLDAISTPMTESIQHYHDKLFKLQDMMKSDAGRQLADERTVRMKGFLKWWTEEAPFSGAEVTSVSA
ncbi:HD domain-containing protein [Xylaria intraflava]|nr:HD domain-containing protein [Xylaria intraflava]